MQAHSCPAGRTVSKRLNLGQDLVADPAGFFRQESGLSQSTNLCWESLPPIFLGSPGVRGKESPALASAHTVLRVTGLHARDCRTWCKFLINKETHTGQVSATPNFFRNSFFGNWIAPTTSRHRCLPAQGVLSAFVDHPFQIELGGWAVPATGALPGRVAQPVGRDLNSHLIPHLNTPT